ncbi:integrase core domain protein [Oesophagostomum dentatum]|uniref:RNA-directed DNA polymerase n=1 Tax=Oesophagostomum dentatum TaxID=61180 RepID=A0A0B1TLR7_OESDE|nr:integrase core domain protein [Oesophagostomum dentatum]
MKMLARSYVYWTNVTKDIEDYVKGCRNCQDAAKAPVMTELFSWPTEKQPWSRIHIDYAGRLNRKMFLVMVDAYSKWPEIIEMTSTSSLASDQRVKSSVRPVRQSGGDRIGQWKPICFKRICRVSEFCNENGIAHIRSPPFHLQSKGQAELFVDTFRRALQKLKDPGTTSDALQKFLQAYSRTPCSASPVGRSKG